MTGKKTTAKLIECADLREVYRLVMSDPTVIWSVTAKILAKDRQVYPRYATMTAATIDGYYGPKYPAFAPHGEKEFRNGDMFWFGCAIADFDKPVKIRYLVQRTSEPAANHRPR